MLAKSRRFEIVVKALEAVLTSCEEAKF